MCNNNQFVQISSKTKNVIININWNVNNTLSTLSQWYGGAVFLMVNDPFLVFLKWLQKRPLSIWGDIPKLVCLGLCLIFKRNDGELEENKIKMKRFLDIFRSFQHPIGD
jgi:hypothetical protein